MDFDDEDKPKEVPRTRRFAPGRAGKPKPKPEPTVEKPSQADAGPSVRESEQEVDVKPMVQPPVTNGPVKMEIDPKEPETDPEVDPEVELMEEDQPQPQPLPQEEEKEDEEEEEEEQEEDEVVREIDVFLNPFTDENTKLFVRQFPLRPSWRPYEMDERCEEVRVNTNTNEVEIDLSMDTDSSNYNAEMGNKYNFTKQTLKTTWRQPPCSDYAIGILDGDKLHLIPVHAIAQLRPSMDYLNSTSEPVRDENWVKLKYHGLDSEFSSGYLNRMMATGDSKIDFNMSPDAYLNSLCHGGSSRNSESKDSLKRTLASLPLEERLRKLLCEGCPVFRYNVLKHYAPECSDEEFLRILQQEAVLVQGLWTAKTKLLTLEPAGVAARDYVLSLFSKGATIKYSVVDSTGRLKGMVKNVLSKLAKDRLLLKDYKFKEPTDVSFIKSYPGIVEKQNVAWAAIKTKIQEMIDQTKGRGDSGRNVVGRNPSKVVKPETSTTLADKAGSSKSSIPRAVSKKLPEETRRALTKDLKKVLQARKVCSFETICQGLRDLAVSTSNQPKADSSMAKLVASAVDSHREELEQVISEVAVNIHGTIVAKSCPEHSEYDPLRRVVIDLFCGSASGTRLKRAEVMAAGSTVLLRPIANNEFTKVMHDICESNNSSGWGLKKPR